MTTALKVLLVLVSFVLIGGVLMQSGKSAGLGSIDGGASTFFGKKKGLDELLAKVTTVAAIVFMVLALLAAVV